jgi:hypothetical protein
MDRYVRVLVPVDELADRCGCTTLIHYQGFPPVLKPQANPAEHQFLRSLDDPRDHADRVIAECTDAVVYRVGRSTSRD